VRRKGFGHVDGCPALDVYGSPDLIPSFIKCVDELQKNTPEDDSSRVNLHVVRPFEPFFAEGYEITPLKAYHGTDNPYIYIIEKDGKSLLYAHDTDVFPGETWEYISEKKKKFDLVSLDCTEGNKHISYHGHMCIERNDETKERLISMGAADEKTVFVINHFSHNGKDCLYDDMTAVAASHGFAVSYDGLEIEI
ncbi:MAG: hypothetical protein KBS59_06360, partial [Clostridiales bacterium]|nr:hypothetical protein [Clostridiales bacterium]